MAIYLIEYHDAVSKKNGLHSMIIEATAEAIARSAAAARFAGDGDWNAASAVVTQIAAPLAANYQGCIYQVQISNVDGTVIHEVRYTAGAETVTQIAVALAKLLRGSPVGGCVLDDGGSKTDDTAAANDDTANDVDLTPATPNANDAIMFGLNRLFGKLTFDIGTVGTGTYTVAWEYWNGSAWTALSGVTDSTTSFKTTGLNRVTFTIPTDWALKSELTLPPLFYVRAKLDAGTVTQAPKANRVWMGPGTLASSSTNTLTAAATSDNIGDKVVTVMTALPGAQELVVGAANDPLFQSKSDQGAAGAALIVVLRDGANIPAVWREFGTKRN